MDLLGRFVDIFVNSAIANDDGTGPDHALHYEEMRNMMSRIKRLPTGREALVELTNHDSKWVRLWTATELLVDEDSSDAKSVLEQLQKDPGIAGFNAETTLSEYANGRLKSPFLAPSRETQ